MGSYIPQKIGFPPQNVTARTIRMEELLEYLRLLQWEEVTPADPRWIVFVGGSDINGNPLEIVLPKDQTAYDLPIYIAKTVDLLSALYEDEPETTIQRIRFFDTDVLTIRNLVARDGESISLELASRQMRQLRKLVGYSANSEQDPRPHFHNISTVGKMMTDHYQFGHTFPGSFGYTVESEIVHQPRVLVNGGTNNVVLLPIERRVMERIARGLHLVNQATQEKSLSLLVESYALGFNAEMCQALAKMPGDERLPLEFDMLWSPKVETSGSLAEAGAVRLEPESYGYLAEASEILEEYQPTAKTIRGRVVASSSQQTRQLSGDMSRSVVIETADSPTDSPIQVLVFLSKEAYKAARNAHERKATVEVSGALHQVGEVWRLSAPRGFSAR